MNRLTTFNLRQRSTSTEPETETLIQQAETEKLVRKAYYERISQWKDDALTLFRLNHIDFLKRKLINLPRSFELLDASQPWMAYWTLHSLRLLNAPVSEDTKQNLIQFIRTTQHPDGGFSGGPYQFAHLATSYGAINSLVSLCCQDALDVIDRPALYNWLNRLRQPDGSFTVHIGGEVDIRGAYCAVVVARLSGLLDIHPDLFDSTAEWIATCQTYEGGFGGLPGIEAHGGYSFCAVAALCLLGRPDLIDLPRLLRWTAHRQMSCEGGFQGRTNKLVDSCYSFWQGAVFPIIEELLQMAEDPALCDEEALFNTSAIQEYVLLCCQKVSFTRPGLSIPNTYRSDSPTQSSDRDPQSFVQGGGGLIDKPGKSPDCYHTCYALSGLSVAQHAPRPRVRNSIEPIIPAPNGLNTIGTPHQVSTVDVLGDQHDNELADVDPLHNLLHDGLAFALTYFKQLNAGESAEVAAKLAHQALNSCRGSLATLVRECDKKAINTEPVEENGSVMCFTESVRSSCSTP